ncbi:MAG: sigma-70 family RNA polymerase sigma factor, partial [Candidatus Binataceae bacterium]
DAEDVVQEALLRALTYFKSFRGENAKAWLLQIVRNAAYASTRLNRGRLVTVSSMDDSPEPADEGDDPETAAIKAEARTGVAALLAALPVELREALVLREVEHLSYKDIAEVTGAPIGTVMSRLWRARQMLATAARVKELAL